MAQHSAKDTPITHLLNKVMLPVSTKRVSATCCTTFPMQKLTFWLKAVLSHISDQALSNSCEDFPLHSSAFRDLKSFFMSVCNFVM